MAENPTSLTEKVSSHVYKLFARSLGQEYSFHNFAHTAEVAEAAAEVGQASGLVGEDLEVVILAAWFHDTGITEVYHNHEEASASIADRFLKKQEYDKDRIAAVKRCIMVTNIETQPITLQEKVIRDADLLHLGTKRFWDRSAMLRAELELVCNKSMSDEEWIKRQYEFLKERRFFTEYATEQYQQRLEKNRAKIDRAHESALKGEKIDMDKLMAAGKKSKKGGKKGATETLGRADRGVETMFRTTSRNHVSFSAMVDSKANIMISINALVISVIISVLFRKLDTNPYMALPTFVFLGVCLLTIVYAVLASRPKVTSGVFTREDIENKQANLLFFGNFYNVPVEDFEWGMHEMLKDKDYLYGSMIRDFYYLGQVLGRKYQHLRMSYNVFMYGFVFSILLYVAMFLLTAQQPVELLPLGGM